MYFCRTHIRKKNSAYGKLYRIGTKIPSPSSFICLSSATASPWINFTRSFSVRSMPPFVTTKVSFAVIGQPKWFI